MIADTGGDLARIEKRLGLEAEQLKAADTLIVHIPPEDLKGLRMPNGNELGANKFWLPGGRTSGGMSEATIDTPAGQDYVEVHLGD